jgi:uncharacterized protein
MKLENVYKFLNCKKFAIVGVSRNEKKFGNIVYKELKKKNYNILPVNPFMDTYNGEKCYKSINELPPDVEALIVVTKPEITLPIVKEAIERGIKHIFLQKGAQNSEAVEYAEENNVNIIQKHCILMFANPSGFHKFHRTFVKFFGLYPK